MVDKCRSPPFFHTGFLNRPFRLVGFSDLFAANEFQVLTGNEIEGEE